MRTVRLPLTVATLTFLAGCANFISAPTADWPWPKGAGTCKTATCDANEALVAYVKASEFCRGVQNYYESGGQRANNTKLAVGLTGTLAGAVIAPVASGKAATAWSGLSGATNGIQATFDEAFSSSLAVNRRAFVVAAVVEGDRRYQGAANENAKVIAAVSMATACANASALADREALQSLTKSPTTQSALKTETTSQTNISTTTSTTETTETKVEAPAQTASEPGK